MRVTLVGPELDGFAVAAPAASVRLLLPSPGAQELVVPSWNGNEFLLPDGSRPVIRTFTPRNVDTESLRLELDVVVHDGGTASEWAASAPLGAEAAVSGPGRGYPVPPEATGFLLAGDETAIPAISQLLESIPGSIPVQVHIETADPSGSLPIPEHPEATVAWHSLDPGQSPGDALVSALRSADIGSEVRIWCAGEAASMHRIRTYLFTECAIPRSQATVRGYWKARPSKSTGSSAV